MALLRGGLTIAALVVMTMLVGGSTLLIGLIYPFRWAMALGSWIWAWGILLAAGVRLTVSGREHLADGKPRFYVGNHQSALDVPIVMRGLRGRVRFMAKDTLFRIPLFGWVMARYDYVPVNRHHPRASFRTLTEMIERLRSNPMPFAVFPEGTRSRDGRMLPFKLGSMKICRMSGMDVVPFSIDGAMNVYNEFNKGIRPGPVRLTFARPIPAEEAAAMSNIELHDRVREVIARQLGQPFEAAPAVETPVMAAEGA